MKKINEIELINQLTDNLPNYNSDVIKGIGDDCAVIKQADGNYLLTTCDSQVDGVHFDSLVSTPQQIGQKAVAVNVSDIATMGGRPTYCMVSLIIPKKLKPDYIQAIYDGIKISCANDKIQIIGGNISSGKQLIIDITMMGEVRSDELLLRSGAKIGDKVLVTGSLGMAAAGLKLIQNPDVIVENKYELIQKQLSPVACLSEAAIIAQSKLATSMIDISDGLFSDIGHICDASNVGVNIYQSQIPVLKSVLQVEKRLVLEPLSLATSGGEDYELLITVSPKSATDLVNLIQSATGASASIIGEITDASDGRYLQLSSGDRQIITPNGWQHF